MGGGGDGGEGGFMGTLGNIASAALTGLGIGGVPGAAIGAGAAGISAAIDASADAQANADAEADFEGSQGQFGGPGPGEPGFGEGPDGGDPGPSGGPDDPFIDPGQPGTPDVTPIQPPDVTPIEPPDVTPPTGTTPKPSQLDLDDDELRRRRANRTSYFDMRQFEAGLDPFTFAPDLIGEGGVDVGEARGQYDIPDWVTDEEIEDVFSSFL